MEKYKKFADGGTGVNPFVPVWSHHKTALSLRALKVVFLLPVALIKLLVFSLALLWLGLAELLCAALFVGALRYPVYRLLTSIGCNIALLALGIWPTGDAVADHRRLKLAPPKTGGGRPFNAAHGTLVIVNQQGFTDVLYLGLRLSPTFVFLAKDGTPVQYGLLGALRRAVSAEVLEPPEKPQSLNDIARQARSGWRGPVAVFVEGANTNGSCILAWKAKTFDGTALLEGVAGVAVTSIIYSKTGTWTAYTPQHTVGTGLRHVLCLVAQPFHTLSTQWLQAAEVAEAIKGKPPAEQRTRLRQILAAMVSGAVEVDITAERLEEFRDFWDVAQRKGYTRQQPAGSKKKA